MKSVSIVVREDAMVPLDRWLATELAARLGRPVPRGLTRKAIVSGLVQIGGQIIRDPGFMARRGPSAYVRKLDWIPAADASAALRVLFEDEWLIAVDKPAGLPTHETLDIARPSLTALVERHVGRRVFVHHRLDAGTSGVVLFAKALEANAGLARTFAGREVEKTYIALVQRPPIDWPTKFTLDSPIAIHKNGTARVDASGLSALTHVRVLQGSRDRVLIEAKPVTGRKHQIRVHLASAGAPILGDTRYGSDSRTAPRLMLHAEQLELDHPITGKRLTLISPRPADFTVREQRLEPSKPPHRLAADRRQGKAAQGPRPGGGPLLVKPLRKGTAPRKPERAGERGSRR
jgi:23S rRNA pseudouridine1911/1915/1917 synthase